MSLSEVKRYAFDLKWNPALRAEAEAHATETHNETPLSGAVAFAVTKGYRFSVEHAKEYLTAKALAAGWGLTDFDLDEVPEANVCDRFQVRFPFSLCFYLKATLNNWQLFCPGCSSDP